MTSSATWPSVVAHGAIFASIHPRALCQRRLVKPDPSCSCTRPPCVQTTTATPTSTTEGPLSSIGTWKAWLSDSGKKTRTTKLWLADLEPRQQQAYGRRRLRKANEARRQEAEARRKEPLEAARELWPTVKLQTQGMRGRPPYRKVLGQMLQRQGYQCSDRDLRYLVKRLQHELCQSA
jgi:hypothetical protein